MMKMKQIGSCVMMLCIACMMILPLAAGERSVSITKHYINYDLPSGASVATALPPGVTYQAASPTQQINKVIQQSPTYQVIEPVRRQRTVMTYQTASDSAEPHLQVLRQRQVAASLCNCGCGREGCKCGRDVASGGSCKTKTIERTRYHK